MKNRGWIIPLIVLLIILILILIGIMIFFLNGNHSFYGFHFNFGYRVSEELVLDETYENLFEEISIDTNASEISVLESIDSNIRVVVYGEKERLEIQDENQKLKIEYEEKKCIGFCFKKVIGKVVVYVPVDYANKLIVNNQFGDIKVGTFTEASLEIVENYGDIEVAEVKHANLKNDYGDISLKKAESASIKQSCGDVYIGTIQEIDVKNSYGDIMIENVLKSLNVEDNCGDIKINHITLEKSSTIKNDLGDIEIGSTNEIYLDAKTSLGDIDIRNNYRKSEITLTIHNSCGDIEVDN